MVSGPRRRAVRRRTGRPWRTRPDATAQTTPRGRPMRVASSMRTRPARRRRAPGRAAWRRRPQRWVRPGPARARPRAVRVQPTRTAAGLPAAPPGRARRVWGGAAGVGLHGEAGGEHGEAPGEAWGGRRGWAGRAGRWRVTSGSCVRRPRCPGLALTASVARPGADGVPPSPGRVPPRRHDCPRWVAGARRTGRTRRTSPGARAAVRAEAAVRPRRCPAEAGRVSRGRRARATAIDAATGTRASRVRAAAAGAAGPRRGESAAAPSKGRPVRSPRRWRKKSRATHRAERAGQGGRRRPRRPSGGPGRGRSPRARGAGGCRVGAGHRHREVDRGGERGSAPGQPQHGAPGASGWPSA